jgi:hypothetical protein
MVRPIPDDSGFGLINSGINFELCISVHVGAPRRAEHLWHAALLAFVYFSGDIDKVARRYSRRLNLLVDPKL